MNTDLKEFSIPEVIARAVLEHTGRIVEVLPVGGGCIANASRLYTERGQFFLKWGGQEIAKTFEAEAIGLRALAQVDAAVTIPEIHGSGFSTYGYILLEWLEPGEATDDVCTRMGVGLAELHRATADRYGFASDNYIGRLPQKNEFRDTWPSFFRDCRLEPQVQMARARGRWEATWNPLIDTVYNRLEDIIPEYPKASLVHGDLWSGNVMAIKDRDAALIDPAVYYGHREVDLAMTELFGGFKSIFYEAYKEAWALEGGYEERRELYNLYHLINHLNLFGASYKRGVETALKRFGS